MPGWMPAFVVVAALAIVLQTVILMAMFISFRRLNMEMMRRMAELQARVDPILGRVNRLLEDSESRILGMVRDASDIVQMARSNAQRLDRVFTEATDLLRSQIVRADQLVTGALESVETMGLQLRKTALGPVIQISAFIKGLKAGIDVIRGMRGRPDQAKNRQEEELFI